MMAHDSVAFRWLARSEYQLGMRAIDRLWRKGHILATDREMFLWQYGAGNRERLDFLVAEDAGEIVGFSGYIRLPWHIYGQNFPGGAGALTIIAPEYRSGLAGLNLIEEADRGLAIVGSFGINKRVARLYELQGRYVTKAFPRILGLGSKTALESYLRSFGYSARQRENIWQQCGKLTRQPLAPRFRLEKLASGNLAEWDAVWRSSFAPNLLGVARTGEYVAWRYLGHPRFAYSCLILRNEAQKIRGMAVFRIMDLGHSISAMRILDFLAADSGSASALAAALAEKVPQNCAYVEFFAPGRQGDALGQIGLTGRGAGLISVYAAPPDPEHCAILSALRVRIPGYAAQEFAEHRNVYFTLADGDQDRPN